ncbi:MAG: sirohydrochlorin chelatase [Alphaproteobacteria bacterium]|nr:sirohydrochlorin chelatase [Alphaproteobacteria bacterium]
MTKGIMICGHGSRSNDAVEQFKILVDKITERMAPIPVDYGFLEFARPTINHGLDQLTQQADDILAVPGMLFAAGHAKNDIPSVLNMYQKNNPDINIRYGRELGIDLKLLDAACERITQSLQGKQALPLNKTLLMVVGRGASDPDANSNIFKIARMVGEAMGFGWIEIAYSGVTFPLVTPALQHATKLGFKRIVVFPYFLFSGILIDRIYQHTDAVAADFPDIEFIKAGYLNSHDKVVDAFLQRIAEIEQGENNMNCQLCKYREQFFGFENEVGLRQESHHHHVEGIGTDADNHTHEHHHEHGDHHHDGHGHHPYPHADHPLGPTTLKKEK